MMVLCCCIFFISTLLWNCGNDNNKINTTDVNTLIDNQEKTSEVSKEPTENDTVQYKIINNVSMPQKGNAFQYDIDNDGITDKIHYSAGQVRVNTKTFDVNKIVDNVHTDYFYLVDIDKNDSFVEMLFNADGPSADEGFSIIRYNKGQYTLLGWIPQYVDHAKFNGFGEIKTTTDFCLLQMFWATVTYKLNDNEFVLQEQPIYDTSNFASVYSNMLKEEILLYSSKDKSSNQISMSPQTVKMIQNDAKNWVQIVGANGVSGWLYLDSMFTIEFPDGTKKDSHDIFDGLFEVG